jgi:hypothetical protein
MPLGAGLWSGLVFGAPFFLRATVMNPDQITGFFASCRRSLAEHHQNLRSRVTRFFGELGPFLAAHRAAQRARDRVEASAFNFFDLVKPDENSLSEIFADLLDPQIGIHGQGTLFLEELLRVAGVRLPEGLEEAQAWVEEETWLIGNPARRIDMMVTFPRFGIAIENKPWASDQVDQVADYVEHMRRLYGERFLFFYWSGHGGGPSSISPKERARLERAGQLQVWSYQREVRKWLEASRRACQAPKVNCFLKDLLSYLARTFVGVPGSAEDE